MAIVKKAPAGAKVFDLPAARTARAEARAGEPSSFIKLSAGYVEIKPELEISVLDLLNEGSIKEAFVRLFVDPKDADALFAEGVSDQDAKAIFEFVAGKSLGELTA